MGKASPPPAPDYTGAANAEAQASKENLMTQNYANRPTINTPWGSQSWQTQAGIDPSTGQSVTQWTQNTNLTPQSQAALDSQMALQQGRSELAGSFMDRVGSEYAKPFDYSGLPQTYNPSAPKNLDTSLGQQNIQRGLNFGDNPAMPSFDSTYRDNIANSLMERMQPQFDRQQGSLETQLANQGFERGSQGYKTALDDLQQSQSRERFNALDSASNEAQRLYQMQMGQRQQGMQEDQMAGNFANQASQQAFQQDMAAGQYGNNAMQTQQNMDAAYANQMNTLRQQGIAEQAQRRGMSLNEMNALLSGQQVSMPNMPSFTNAGISQTPQLMQAAQNQYSASMDAFNAQQQQQANMMGGLSSLASTAMMFSDKRLKRRIKRVGTHAIGVGIYEYDIFGYPQRGVLAQEVQSVRPDLVAQHPSGFLMVNYGGL